MFPFLALLVAVFSSQLINEAAIKKLTQNQKADLIDGFAKNRIWSYALVIGLVGIYFLSLELNLASFFWIQTAYFFLIVLLMGIQSYLTYRKLVASEFPESYIKSYFLGVGIRFLGLILFIGLSEL